MAKKVKATLTATQAPGRFGALNISGDLVSTFKEKPKDDSSLINGGFFVLAPEVLNYIEGDNTSWEEGPVQMLAEENNLAVFKHNGFWQPMDTLRDQKYLQEMWQNNQAPWKIW